MPEIHQVWYVIHLDSSWTVICGEGFVTEFRIICSYIIHFPGCQSLLLSELPYWMWLSRVLHYGGVIRRQVMVGPTGVAQLEGQVTLQLVLVVLCESPGVWHCATNPPQKQNETLRSVLTANVQCGAICGLPSHTTVHTMSEVFESIGQCFPWWLFGHPHY